MDDLCQYIICITAAAIIVAILTGLTGSKSASGAITRLSSGLFLTFVILHPLIEVDFKSLIDWAESFSFQSSNAVTAGEKIAADAIQDIIKANTESYILDKAQTYDAELTVEITLDQKHIPYAVKLNGTISPYGKVQLKELITKELGITEANQVWTG